MSEAFNLNFKNMLLYVGKAATQIQGCPMTSIILSELIKWMFDDKERALQILDKFKENRLKINEKYVRGTAESLILPPSVTYADALIKRDRSLFKHIDLFPGKIASQYTEQISWFSNFLVSGMNEKYMSTVWKYLDKIDKQAGPITQNLAPSICG